MEETLHCERDGEFTLVQKAASSLPRVLTAIWRHVSSLQWVTARRQSVTWSAVMHHTLWGASEAARVLALPQLGRTCTTYVLLTWSAVGLQRFTPAVLFCSFRCLVVPHFLPPGAKFYVKKSAFELSVRTHPGLVEAAVLTAHAEGLDGWRRLLRHQQSLLQLDLLLQLHQHRRLHAVPEGHSRGYMCSFASEMSRPPLCSLTWRRCGRSPADRDKLAEAPCAALREKTKTQQLTDY